MPIRHIFSVHDFGNGFHTHNAILDITPYKPEVMVVGTFNPGSDGAIADFFYGRNFFWPAFKNLFVHDTIELTARRMPAAANFAPAVLDPPLHGENGVFDLCSRLKLTFADLILEVLHQGDPQFDVLPNDNIVLNGQEYNLIKDGQAGNVGGLQQLHALGQVHWNTDNIISYLCENPQIHTVYFTRRPTGVWNGPWGNIVHHPCMEGRHLTNIFTPSGAGGPVYYSMPSLLHHWLHNITPNFGRLTNEWLVQNGVTLNNF